MNLRTVVGIVLLGAVGAVTGCTAKEDKQPKAPANAPKLEPKKAGAGGPVGPGAKGE